MKRVALDLGSSFTRCAAAWEGRVVHARAASAPGQAAHGAERAVTLAAGQLGLAASHLLREVDSVRLATTLTLDGLAEPGEPVRVGLLVSPGIERLWQAGEGAGSGSGEGPVPEAHAPLVRAVDGAVAGNGEVLQPLDEAMVLQAVDDLLRQGARVLAVALTHSAANPVHELRCQELIAQHHPAHLLGAVPVILSHLLGGRLGEASRLAAVVQAAGLHGPMRGGLARIEQTLQRLGCRQPLLLAHRDGGLAGLSGTAALQMLCSSPRAGLAAAQQIARLPGHGPFVVADLGGSRLDLGIVQGGEPPLAPGSRGAAPPRPRLIALPGGTAAIARLDSVFRSVLVGPASAGAVPGPACYGRGGSQPTLTDADLLLGYLEPLRQDPGGLPLWREQSRRALHALATALAVDETTVAWMIRAAAHRDMGAVVAAALQAEGLLAADATLLACGGGGPLHACGIARAAGVPRVLLPPHAAAFSAVGALAMNLMQVHEQALSVPLVGARLAPNAPEPELWQDYRSLNRVLEHLEAQGREALERQGVLPAQARHRVELDLRFGAQRLEVPVVFEPGRFTGPRDVQWLAEQLTRACHAGFGAGTAAVESGVWIANFRVFTFVEGPRWPLPQPEAAMTRQPAPQASVRRRCTLAGSGPAMLPVHELQQLGPGLQVPGPALLELGDATCLLEPGWRATVGPQGAVWLQDEGPPPASHPPSDRLRPAPPLFSDGAST